LQQCGILNSKLNSMTCILSMREFNAMAMLLGSAQPRIGLPSIDKTSNQSSRRAARSRRMTANVFEEEGLPLHSQDPDLTF